MENQPLTEEQIAQELNRLDVAWSAIPGQGLVRVFDTGSFKAGVVLVARLAEIAEAQDHQPDVYITSDDVEVTLTTHEAGGVTRRDIEFAKYVDKVIT